MRRVREIDAPDKVEVPGPEMTVRYFNNIIK